MGTQPAIRIERGHPTDEELAAVVAVLTGVVAHRLDRPTPARAVWCVPARGFRRAAATRVPGPRSVRLVAHGPVRDAGVRPRPVLRTRTRAVQPLGVAA